MQREIAKGENPAFTSFVGASAAPSQTPAVNPQMTPRLCSDKPVFCARCAVLAIDIPRCTFVFSAITPTGQFQAGAQKMELKSGYP
jgi:hypothetical protein